MKRKIMRVLCFLVSVLLEFNSGLIPDIEDTDKSNKSNGITTNNDSLQDLLTTSREIQKSQTEVNETTFPLRTTTSKVTVINKRETTLSIISVLQDSTTISLKIPTTENTPSNDPPLKVVPVKRTTLPLSPPLTLPYQALSKTREPSSTESSLAFTNGKASPTQIDGKEQCYTRDTLVCVDELKCHGSGEIDCSSFQDYKDEYYYDDEKTSSTSTTSPINPKELSDNITLKAYLNFNRRRKKIHQTTKAGRNNNNNFLDDDENGEAKPCVITGDVRCLPVPTDDVCRGKSICGDPKKEETSSGLKDWEIAVISVLTILGVVLLSSLIYVIYSSWKKKKVRPRPPVPTTNVHHIMGRRIHA